MAIELTTVVLVLALFACAGLAWCIYTLHVLQQKLSEHANRPDTGAINRLMLRELTSLVLEVQDGLAEVKKETREVGDKVDDATDLARNTHADVDSLQRRLACLVTNVASIKLVLNSQRPERVLASDGSMWVVYGPPESDRSPYCQ